MFHIFSWEKVVYFELSIHLNSSYLDIHIYVCKYIFATFICLLFSLFCFFLFVPSFPESRPCCVDQNGLDLALCSPDCL